MSRQQTGKTSIPTILTRMFVANSIPLWFVLILVAVSGLWALILPAALGYYAVLGIKYALACFASNLYADKMYANDPGYQKWRADGGNPFFDAQGLPFNADSAETRLATVQPAWHAMPPDARCGRCGGVWGQWGGKQCSVCLTYWDANTQQYMWIEPDPRLAKTPTVDPNDPAVFSGRKP